MVKLINYSQTVNWHFTNQCNMTCRYCFVPILHQELIIDESFEVLEKLRQRFDKINFVGGEPTLSKKLPLLIKKAKELGFIVSIVTNGYALIKNPHLFNSLYKYLDIVGLSVDSLKKSVNIAIGRCYHNVPLEQSEIIDFCKLLKNKGIAVKINTVVSKANLNEDFNSFFESVQPYKIKMFQVLKPNVITKHNYDDMLISKEEYYQFVNRHNKFANIIFVEDNELMINSYYVLDSIGRFRDDLTGKLSPSILDVSVDEALSKIYVDEEKYNKRYEMNGR